LEALLRRGAEKSIKLSTSPAAALHKDRSNPIERLSWGARDAREITFLASSPRHSLGMQLIGLNRSIYC
jgi:hypothetical protein